MAGYTVIQVPTREAAVEWTRRFPARCGPDAVGETDVRQLFEPDDFEPSAALGPGRALDVTP